MTRVFSAILLFLAVGLRAASAQQDPGVWVQIEAQPTLQEAQERAQAYASALPDVNGFRLNSGWYAIVVGPYARPDAQQVLQVYRSEGQIPRDSFIAFSSGLGQQFWPVGANVLNRGTVAAPVAPVAQAEDTLTIAPTQDADETRAQALQSERLLTAQERRNLQTALQAAGFYNSTIDGAFGQGTRRSMGDWQRFNGYEATGVLTTAQRKALMDDYNAPLTSVGMARYSDDAAGITMDFPLGAVSFDRYEAPFVHFNSASDLNAKALLISQDGDKRTLRALYEVMQSLEIVPLNGPRELRGDRFTLEGRGNGVVSFTQARLTDGKIKGFTLVWPEGDEARRLRVLAAMASSFDTTDAVLDAAAGLNAEQSIDLVSGLQIRKPRLSRSGFFADDKGTVLTVSEAVENCTRITLDGDQEVQLAVADDEVGVAVLRPAKALAPMSVAAFSPALPRLQSDIAVSGFSYQGALGAPTLTFGQVADVRGLNGETGVKRLALSALPGDAGGPVFNDSGNVVGMLLPPPSEGRSLPASVSLAATGERLTEILAQAGVSGLSGEETTQISPNELSRRATGMTVLVHCWE
ncbi:MULTISPECIES: serine protease [unclassified Ruegeria]|uniref:serine protease n=1 Tax=unclassified Ruegeria TaxID=2625375 RepID=UPI00149092FF|nr:MULTISPECIES: serine protease [unclassified Ruegeria]NOD87012.1 peptidoglycan-binding protein [Ruegeria sp. HKCCD4318]NOE12567.1 peptidoglycan-binding protein [Ruegeria sp. HKCCD4318-2]NOG09268.1 peptidoglycan-binding protein [Ruegeria sp. HKCCD4315]